MLDVMAGRRRNPYRAAPLARLVERCLPRASLRLATLAKSALGPIDAETVAAFKAACECGDMGHRLEP
jgi:hypothetical protein